MFTVQVLQSFTCNMRVNLRCGYIAMAQQHLDDAQVRTMINQMRGERMSEYVR